MKLYQVRNLKIGIWIYIILLIFEGALRKWVFPSMALPLLIVRDPFAVWLLIYSLQKKLVKFDFYMISFISIGFISFFTAVLYGHGSVLVALYGARAFIVHFPLVFIIGSIFNRNDVVKVGNVILMLLIPMTILSIIQYYSPQSSFVNRGVGNDIEGAGFGGAMGFYRPPGTFSFINGLSSFYGLSSCFLFFFLINSKLTNKWILIMGGISVGLSIPFTISRAVFFQNVVCFIFFLLVLIRKRRVNEIVIIIVSTILLLLVFSSVPPIRNAIEVFMSRFENASISEGGVKGTLWDRTFLTLFKAIKESPRQKIMGEGVGADTNVGYTILGVNNRRVNDFEWSRIIFELGPLLGLCFIFVRLILVMKMFKYSIWFLNKNYSLPWMIFSLAGFTVLQGQIAQPTQLGFIVLFGGLFISSLKHT